MDELLRAVVDLAAKTTPDSVRQLCALLKAKTSMADIRPWALNPATRTRLDRLFAAWPSQDVTADELAGLLMGACIAHGVAADAERVELVWTGPGSVLVSTRKTAQALLHVIDAARERLFITSFVAYEVPPILIALRAAITRDVKVAMLLELSEDHGGTLNVDSIGKMKSALPGARILTWLQKPDGFAGGRVHAKCAVADEKVCFVSSANLTSYAMERNMEAGVLVTGGDVPRDLQRHFEALETTCIIGMS
jgi:phosphatidylserine/phosphatidylglycerophosphate/cardiolipin synthase-like enzyme